MRTVKIYKYKGVEYPNWESCKANFPNTSFVAESELPPEVFANLGITVIERQETEPGLRPDETIRAKRDALLSETDKYLLPDFPIGQIELDTVKAYRQYLRDYTKQSGWENTEPLEYDQWKKGDADLYEGGR